MSRDTMDFRDKARRMAGINRTAERLEEIAAAAEKKRRMRRFPWCRDHKEVADDLRWRLVAQMAGAPLYLVEAFQRRLDHFANSNDPRGSLEGFSIPALAAHWAIPNADLLARIYAAMETPEIGWIDQDFLVTFWHRNPDTEDTGAAERMRRMRQRRKAAKENTPNFPQTESVTRNNRNVTARADQIRSKTGNSVDNHAVAANGESPRLSEGQGNGAVIDPQVWIENEGRRLLIERMRDHPGVVDTRLQRWLREISFDYSALAVIIQAAAVRAKDAARLHALIAEGVRLHLERLEGPQLALVAKVAEGTPAGKSIEVAAPPAEDDLKKAIGDE